MNNIPEVKLGIVAVSRDCFPIGLSISRRKAIVEASIDFAPDSQSVLFKVSDEDLIRKLYGLK